MKADKLTQLRQWRDRQARKEGVEIFRVLSNQTLEEIVLTEAKTENELLKVKGIKDKKLAKYGQEILNIMNEAVQPLSAGDNFGVARAAQEIIAQTDTEEKIFSVSAFLDLVNIGLRTFAVKIKGEVSSVDERGGNYYFSLKDKEDGSTISCLIWKSNYRVAGVDLKAGMEVVADGFPNVYKPSGRLSFQAETIELVGEGALKKQYEELKAKLDKEGLFALERKKPIPLFPQRIGLITSRQGEAIFDFRTNLGKFGFQIKFVDTRVEGVSAVSGLLKAVKFFKDKDIDVLVLVRGGGSLESLLSFNNELLARAIADFPKPVVTGIGHEQDVSLLDLVADRSCSTPTGTAKLLSYSWEQALARVNLHEKDIMGRFGKSLHDDQYRLENLSARLRQNFGKIFDRFRQLEFRLRENFQAIGERLQAAFLFCDRSTSTLNLIFKTHLAALEARIDHLGTAIRAGDPDRMLSLGFSLVRSKGRIIKNVDQVSQGEEIQVELHDGEFSSVINKIKKKDEQ